VSFVTHRAAKALAAAAAVLWLATAPLAVMAQQAPGPASVAAAPAGEYRLGPGDVVRIAVFQNPDLTLETRVNESGVVSYPLLGTVRLGSLTLREAEKVVADGLRNGSFVRDPQVTLVLLQVRGNQVSVLGQVNRPGRYPLETTTMRLSEMVALAGGIAAGGSDTVVLTGTRDGQSFRREIDLPQLFSANSGNEDNPVLHNGDTLWIDRQPLLYIYGEVQRPGPLRLERGMTLMQVLATAGGPTLRGTDRGIRVHRTGPDGRRQVLEAKLDDPLQAGDVVFVRESLF
jgi:polysaccharide biosynthesis/export protein